MTIDRAELFRLAWARTRTDQAAQWVYDWTPGPRYGARRAATPAERRAVFARHLKAAWAEAKSQAAYRAAQRAAFVAQRPAEAIRRDIWILECKDRLFTRDFAQLDALRLELFAA